jgi:hypothetical protein
MTIEETERQQFRGVVCLHCKAPIAVPAVVGKTGGAQPGGTESSQGNSQVFNLRCPACHKEKPYWTREIVNFDGTPGLTVPPVQPASVRTFRQGEIGKAAKV